MAFARKRDHPIIAPRTTRSPIFARRDTPAAVEDALGTWARRAIAEMPATAGLQPTTLDRIETIDVGG